MSLKELELVPESHGMCLANVCLCTVMFSYVIVVFVFFIYFIFVNIYLNINAKFRFILGKIARYVYI